MRMLLVILLLAAGTARGELLDPPRQAALLDTDGLAFGVAMAGNLAVICDHDAGVILVDLTVPTAPTVLGSLDTPGFARNAAVQGNLVGVADRSGGLRVLSIADPDQLRLDFGEDEDELFTGARA